MTIFRITPSSYFGDEAILVTADRDGLRLFVSTLQAARSTGDATFDSEGVQYRIKRESGAADLEVGDSTVVCRFDDAKITEIIDLSEPLIASNTAGHQYVDIETPTATLIISVDESG